MTDLPRRYMIIDVSAAWQRPSGSSGTGKNNCHFQTNVSTTTTSRERDESAFELTSLLISIVCVSTGCPALHHHQLPLEDWTKFRREKCALTAVEVLRYQAAVILHKTSRLCQSTLEQLYSCVLGCSVILVTYNRHLLVKQDSTSCRLLSSGSYNNPAEVTECLFVPIYAFFEIFFFRCICKQCLYVTTNALFSRLS